MVCTQRPSLVDKNVLSQCGNQLIGKLVIKNDLQAVAQFFSGHELPKHLTTLEPGSSSPWEASRRFPGPSRSGRRTPTTAGHTPKLGNRVVKPFSIRGDARATSRLAGKPGQGRPHGGALVGINPTFPPEDVPTIVKRDKSFIFFGKEEVVANATADLPPPRRGGSRREDRRHQEEDRDEISHPRRADRQVRRAGRHPDDV